MLFQVHPLALESEEGVPINKVEQQIVKQQLGRGGRRYLKKRQAVGCDGGAIQHDGKVESPTTNKVGQQGAMASCE